MCLWNVFVWLCSMVDVYSDDVGGLDFRRSQSGSGMSKTAQAKRFAAELQRVAEETYNALFSVQQLKTLAQVSDR